MTDVRRAPGVGPVTHNVFWPESAEAYREKYLQPQLGLFETVTTRGHIVAEGSPAREDYRSMIFFGNAYHHWQAAVREPQRPRPAPEKIETPNAHGGHPCVRHDASA